MIHLPPANRWLQRRAHGPKMSQAQPAAQQTSEAMDGRVASDFMMSVGVSSASEPSKRNILGSTVSHPKELSPGPNLRLSLARFWLWLKLSFKWDDRNIILAIYPSDCDEISNEFFKLKKKLFFFKPPLLVT